MGLYGNLAPEISVSVSISSPRPEAMPKYKLLKLIESDLTMAVPVSDHA